MDLESILFRAWFRIGTGSSGISNSFVPTVRPTTCPLLGQNDNDFASDDSAEQYEPNPFLTPVSTSKKPKELNVYSIEKKKCPFCEDTFGKGNEFSSHLLKCTARRKARKQRRKKKKASPEASDVRNRKCVTPGRKMPWE